MASRYLIRESAPCDLYRLVQNLRPEDELEVTSLGQDPRKALRACYRNGAIRRTAEIDGEIAAMWGLCGAFLCDTGEPYLLTAKSIERMPVAFVREARAQVSDMLALRSRLVGYVDAKYQRACRFLGVLGFDLGEPQPTGVNRAMFRKFELDRAWA